MPLSTIVVLNSINKTLSLSCDETNIKILKNVNDLKIPPKKSFTANNFL
jgi:hypothetical protein